MIHLNITTAITKTSFTQLQPRPLPLVAMQVVADVEVAPLLPKLEVFLLISQIVPEFAGLHLDCLSVAWCLISLKVAVE